MLIATHSLPPSVSLVCRLSFSVSLLLTDEPNVLSKMGKLYCLTESHENKYTFEGKGRQKCLSVVNFRRFFFFTLKFLDSQWFFIHLMAFFSMINNKTIIGFHLFKKKQQIKRSTTEHKYEIAYNRFDVDKLHTVHTNERKKIVKISYIEKKKKQRRNEYTVYTTMCDDDDDAGNSTTHFSASNS